MALCRTHVGPHMQFWLRRIARSLVMHNLMSMRSITEVSAADFGRWGEHLVGLFAESGRGDLPFFSPLESWPLAVDPDGRSRFESRRATQIGQPNWMRAWTIDDSSGRIVAHVDLSGSNIRSVMHRATLGIGCEQPVYRQGLG